jgi:anaerobic magnesium-protoporphyrin IX monomethyl ester cyclase
MPKFNVTTPIRVVLVQPSEPFGAMPDMPASILGLASILEEAGMEVDLLDARLDNLSVVAALKRIEQGRYDIIGITGQNNAYRFIKDFCCESKRRFPHIPIMAGGSFIFSQPEIILRRVPIDVACTGEGDEIIVDLVARLLKNETLEGLHNIAYLKNNEFIKSEYRLVQNLDTIPPPAYHLLDMPRYLGAELVEYYGGFFLPIPSGRGCSHHCYYCGRLYDKIRRPSPEKLIKLLDKLNHDYGLSNFIFYDDGGLSPRSWILSFCSLMTHRSDYHFGLVGSPDEIDDEICSELVKAGCSFIGMGVEHLNKEIQTAFFRTAQSKKIENAWKTLKRHGLNYVGSNLLWGHPKDTILSFREAYKEFTLKAEQYNIPHFWMAGLVIYQNSQLFKDAMALGKINDFEDYMYASTGYGPYVNLTSEDDDLFRGFIAERRLFNDLELARAEFDLLCLETELDISKILSVQERIEQLSRAVLILKQLLQVPLQNREPHREALESILDVAMYEPKRKYYRELACINEIVSIPPQSRILVYHPQAFNDEALMRLFASINEAALELVAFVDIFPIAASYEGYPCIPSYELSTVISDVLVIPELSPGRILLEFKRATLCPELQTVVLPATSLCSPFWGRKGLVSGYYNPKYYRFKLGAQGIVRNYQFTN